MIAYTEFFPGQGFWYVRELPGQGGKDWGWTNDNTKAMPISRYWQRRFVADMRYVNRPAYLRPAA